MATPVFRLWKLLLAALSLLLVSISISGCSAFAPMALTRFVQKVSRRHSFDWQSQKRREKQILFGAGGASRSEGGGPLARNLARTCVRQFLTQRAIQSFIFLLAQVRDPHTAAWIEDFSGTKNLLEYHGTGAFNVTRFEHWDTLLLEMLQMPKEMIILEVKKRGPGRGGSKNNPYLKDQYIEFEIDIDPPSLASRIMSVREQIAREWLLDLDLLVMANDQILDSYLEKSMDDREDDREVEEDVSPSSEQEEEDEVDSEIESMSDAGDSDYTSPYSAPPERKEAFDRTVLLLYNSHFSSVHGSSSPLRKGNFDLLFLLATQESIHRVLRDFQASGSEHEASFQWLRSFYVDRLATFFDGFQKYGRADDFIEELLLTPPSMVTANKKVCLSDPFFIAEKIIHMRGLVLTEWKDTIAYVPQDHLELRKVLLTVQMEKMIFSESPQSTHTEIIEAGDFE